jgi:hypothetical protein
MLFTPTEKAHCVIWFAVYGKTAPVQRRFRTLYGRRATAPDRKTIKEWFMKFMTTGSVNRKKRTNTR